MAALAGRTRRIKFGMNVVSLALRDPVLVAKQCATIDVLSEGRLLPAFGIGSPRAPEWAALHVDTRTRGRKTDEGLEIVRRLWREDSVDFTGEHYRLSGATISPKPVQADLPMWIGGGSEAAIRRTARSGRAGRGDRRRRRRPRASSPPSRLPPPRPAAASTTTTTARASPSISGGRRSRHCSGRWTPTPSARATTLRVFRRRRRRPSSSADRRLRRSRRLEVRAAPRGGERRGRAVPDPPAHRAGAAAGRLALATPAKAAAQ